MPDDYGVFGTRGERNMASEDNEPSLGLQARRLLRAARSGTLATVSPSSDGGQPFASLVTPAIAGDGGILLLLSDLSEHTRHLRAEPRCSVLAAGPAESANPQTAPRVTVTGLAAISDTIQDRARFLAVHPYAALYADFGDFHLWRIEPRGGLLVGGFARANRLRMADLVPEAADALASAEPGILSHCNNDHADAMAAIGLAASGRAGAWRMTAVDTDGLDIEMNGSTTRVDFASPVTDGGGVRSELVRLTRLARQTLK
jgi:putative heme iron utilization protein